MDCLWRWAAFAVVGVVMLAGAPAVGQTLGRGVPNLDIDQVAIEPGEAVRPIRPGRAGHRGPPGAVGEQIVDQLHTTGRRTRRFKTAFEQVRSRFDGVDPGQTALVSRSVIDRFDADLDDMAAGVERVQRDFERLGYPGRARYTRRLGRQLGILQQRLGLLGLRLETRGEAARVANALDFDFELLLDSFHRLEGSFQRPFSAPSVRLIRPERALGGRQEVIRPSEAIEPSERIIRPERPTEPAGGLIRPSRSIRPDQTVIGPPTGDNPGVGRPKN